MINDPFPVCLTFDVDAEAGVIGRDAANADRPVALSMGRYGPQTALPLILDLLDKHETKATFFVPGWTADHHTDAIAECAKRGHEVAHHGYHHVPPSSFANAEEEREEIERGIEAIEKAAGTRPTGYRAPAWELSTHTLGLLAGLGFVYSSNMMDSDGPYEHDFGGGGAQNTDARLLELPVSWTLDDYPYFMSRPERTAAEVEEIWRDEFDALREREGAAFILTMHPQVIGRPGRLAMLDSLVAYIRHSGDAEFFRCDEFAQLVRA